MSEAFHQAWVLLKAPLDVDSINFDNINSKTEPVAFFDDAERNERIPMWLNTKQGLTWLGMGDRGNYLWEPHPDDPSWLEPEKRVYPIATASLYDHGMQNPNVYWPYYRRGYGTSLYDLAAYYRASQGRVVKPSKMQSEEGRGLWEQQITNQIPRHDWPKFAVQGIDSQDYRHTDWPEDFHWRPTV